MPRIALFTLGQYRRTAPQADIDAFVAAFRNHATAAYRSYFSKYTDQILKVTGSHSSAARPIFIVRSQLGDPGSSQAPAEVALPGAHRRRQSRCWRISLVRSSGCRWNSATSSSPSRCQNNGNVRT